MKILDDKQKACISVLKVIDQIMSENDIWYSLAYGSALGAYREGGFIAWDGDIDLVIKIEDQKRVSTLLRNRLPENCIYKSHERELFGGSDEIDISGISADDMHIDIYTLIGGPNDIRKGYRFQRYCRLIHRLFECKTMEVYRIRNKLKIPFVYVIRMIEHLVPDKLLRQYVTKVQMKYPVSSSKFLFPFANDGKKGEYMESFTWLNVKRIPFENLLLPVPEDTIQYLRNLYGDDFMIPQKY